MKLWLDDKREMPKDYDFKTYDVEQAKELILTGSITHVAFDHDLGYNKATGYDLAVWIEELAFHGKIKPMTYSIQSDNSVGRIRIRQAMDNAIKYWSN